METVTHNVVVHKASVPLLKGESLRDFTGKVSDAGRDHLTKKLNLGNKVDIYMVEAFSDSAVYNVYKYGENIQPGKRSAYYAVPYKRKSNGDFEMGEAKEVIRVTRFEAKPALISKSKKTTFGNDVSTWEETQKSFWNNVL